MTQRTTAEYQHRWKDHDGWWFVTNGTTEQATLWEAAAHASGVLVLIESNPRDAYGNPLDGFRGYTRELYALDRNLSQFWETMRALEARQARRRGPR